MDPMMEELAYNGLKTDGRAVRRKYNRLLKKYKEVKDHNSKSGIS